MSGRIAGLLLVATVAILAPSAAGSPSRSVPIRLGVGIGPINLGMSGEQVRRAIGRPRAVIDRRVFRGQPYIEFEYQYGAWNIGLLGRKGHRRVVLVGTGLTRHRTPEGLGVDSKGWEVTRRLRGRLRERECWLTHGKPTQWFLRHPRSETIFFPGGVPGPTPDPTQETRIHSVEIRALLVAGCGL